MYQNIFFADIETDLIRANVILNFKSGACINMQNEFFTTNQDKYLDYIIDKFSYKKPPIFYFHNMGFDFTILFEELVMKKIKKVETKYIVRGSQLIAVIFYKRDNIRRRKIAEMRDFYAMLPLKLAIIGEDIGEKKLDFDFNNYTLEELKKYNLQDCRVMQKALKILLQSVETEFGIKINKIPFTIASFGRHIFKVLNGSVYECKNDYINEYLRRFFHGGRTEVFDFNINYGVYDCDKNSLYVSVMSQYTFNKGNIYYYRTHESLETVRETKDFIGIECIIEEKDDYPLMPLKKEGKLIFANGIKHVFLFKEELDYLINKGTIKVNEILRVYCGSQDFIFKTFSDKCYKLRSHKIGYYDMIFKLIGNSFYGKNGEKREKESITIKELEMMTAEDFKNSDEEIDGKFIIKTKTINRWIKINVMNAMKITALARLELHKDMMKVISSNAKLLYCDTDSLFTNKEVFKVSKDLGDMKLEGFLEVFIALNPKEYFYISKDGEHLTRMKGFEKRKDTETTIDDFLKRYLKIFKRVRKTTFKESLNKYKLDKDYFKKSVEVTKRKMSFYCKRKIEHDLTTTPINITDNLKDVELHNANVLLNAYWKRTYSDFQAEIKLYQKLRKA